MQRIFCFGVLAAGFLALPAAAEGITGKGAAFCESDGEMVVLGWRTGADGEIELLGDLHGIGGTMAAGAIIAVTDRRTIVLREKQLVVVTAEGVRTGTCRSVTNDIASMVEALK